MFQAKGRANEIFYEKTFLVFPRNRIVKRMRHREVHFRSVLLLPECRVASRNWQLIQGLHFPTPLTSGVSLWQVPKCTMEIKLVSDISGTKQ